MAFTPLLRFGDVVVSVRAPAAQIDAGTAAVVSAAAPPIKMPRREMRKSVELIFDRGRPLSWICVPSLVVMVLMGFSYACSTCRPSLLPRGLREQVRPCRDSNVLAGECAPI